MTLIELLIVIVILTTLVGGVIPVLSPNNDTRKIRAAARGLQGYITVAQAQAARTGRPHGIAFRESSVGSGVALEVFGLEVPPPFAGFSSASAARLELNTSSGFLYVRFVLADTLNAPGTGPVPSEYVHDPIPPYFVRPNDQIVIDGVAYRFNRNRASLLEGDTGFYKSLNSLQVERVEESGQTAAFVKAYPPDITKPKYQWDHQLTAPKQYKIIRQPTNSAGTPYQLPAGIVLDMQASVTEGSGNLDVAGRFPAESSLFSTLAANQPNNVGILFSPTGAVDRVIFNGVELTAVSRIALLLGRIENAGIDPATVTPGDSTTYPWAIQTGEKLEDVQDRVNWLNLDSRILSIVPSNGRAVVSETAFVDLSLNVDDDNDGNLIAIDPDDQIEAAHGLAHDMSTVGGN